MRSRIGFFAFPIVFLLTACTWMDGKVTRNEFLSASAECGDTLQGSGTSGSPYQICSAALLKALGNDSSSWGSHFELTKNLDLSGVELTPIGSTTTQFTGTFDGKGYTLSNLSMSSSSLAEVGLFGVVRNATIRNLTLTNVSVSGSAGSSKV